MTMKFYKLSMKVEELENAWYLGKVVDGGGDEILSSNFTTGSIFDLSRNPNLTVISTDPNGRPVDFRMTFLGVPVVSNTFGDVISKFDARSIQRIPVTVTPQYSGYEILNIVEKRECLDYEKTSIDRYTHSFYPPEQIGKIKALYNIAILPELVKGHHIFRLAEWDVIIIVSSALKDALESEGFVGMNFTAVWT